jgi:hypothetical protein
MSRAGSANFTLILPADSNLESFRLYVQRLEDQARQGVNVPELSEHQSLQSTLHRGWYWGSEQFREYLLKKVDAVAIRRNRNYQSAQIGRDHGQAEAEKIVQQGLERFGLAETDLESLPGSDPRKVSIAGFIHQSTTTPQGWTAERLRMKSAANVSQLLSRAKNAGKAKIKPAKPAI